MICDLNIVYYFFRVKYFYYIILKGSLVFFFGFFQKKFKFKINIYKGYRIFVYIILSMSILLSHNQTCIKYKREDVDDDGSPDPYNAMDYRRIFIINAGLRREFNLLYRISSMGKEDIQSYLSGSYKYLFREISYEYSYR